MSYLQRHLNKAVEIIKQIDADTIEQMADLLATVKAENRRVFF